MEPDACFFFQAEDGIRDLVRSRGLGDVYKRQRRTRPDLEVGICGEHGGDPKTIAFCHQIGLNYVLSLIHI